jgi:hypothetical protein
MIEAVSSSEMLASFYLTTWHNIPEDGHLEMNMKFERDSYLSPSVAAWQFFCTEQNNVKLFEP